MNEKYEQIIDAMSKNPILSKVKADVLKNKKKKLSKINREYTSIWKRLFTDGYDCLAEVIAVNPSTNKIYVSDSKNNLLYEIDG